VVVKIARDDSSAEAELSRQIEHPDVPAVLDRGVTPLNHRYIVLEWIDGQSLDRIAVPWIGQESRRAVQFIARLGRILESAHACGVVHCDLKPDNVRIGKDGRPVLLDFDLAVTLGHKPDGASRGNLGFMAPEQYRIKPSHADDGARSDPTGGGLSPQADIYGLGGLLVYLLTGQPINGLDATQAQASLAARRAWTGFVLDATLTALVHKAVEPETSRRYRSMSHFVGDLERWLHAEPIEWLKPSLPTRLRLWARRRPGRAVASIAILSVAVGGLIGVFVWQDGRAKAEAARIETEAKQQQAMLREVNDRTTAELNRLRGIAKLQLRQFASALWGSPTHRQGEEMAPVLAWLGLANEHRILGDGDELIGVNERLDALRRFESHLDSNGQSTSVTQLLTRVAIAELLIRTNRPAEALELIRAIRESWQARLDDTDALSPGLDAMELVAKRQLGSVVTPEEIAAMRARLHTADAPSSYGRLLDSIMPLDASRESQPNPLPPRPPRTTR
jgi:hypothetical protein